MKDRATTNATLLIEVILKEHHQPHMPLDKSKLITGFCQSIDGSLQRLWQMGLEFWAEKSNTHSLFEHNIFWRIKLWAS
jgi:hypothetical protein